MMSLIRKSTRSRLRPTVHRLVSDVVADSSGTPLAGDQHVSAAAEDLLSHIGGMAPHLGAGMAALTLSFDAWCTASSGGRRFHDQSLSERRRCFDAWRRLPGPLKSWTLFYEKMGTFSYWAVVEEAEFGHSGAHDPRDKS